ncbi:MAG: FAD-dependent oxidoreductase [Chthoniobacteraceae bacterium]
MFRLPAFLLLLAAPVLAQEPDVLVYGATPAGIAAALAAAADGEKVLLVEPADRIGGMLTNGLSHTDFRTFESLTGAFLDFTRAVEAHYRETYGADAPQTKNFRGNHGEPKVNQLVLEKMLAAQPRITVWRSRSLEALKCSVDGEMRSAEIAIFHDGHGKREQVSPRWFIDATYEGDLMAAAGVEYRVGREGRGEFGEPLAPDNADSQLQAYNFRLIMTRDPANRVAPKPPPGYKREDFTGVLPMLKAGKIDRIFGMEGKVIYRTSEPPLPNGKYDVNDKPGAPVRLSLPGANDAWPDGEGGKAIRSSPREDPLSVPPFSRLGLAMPRARIFEEHLRWNVGLLYFLQNDKSVPAKFRDEAREWGWCRDEFTDNAHLPSQLYVREARRMTGRFIFTEKDTDHAAGDARAVPHTDAIAMGDYGPNCHGTAHEGSHFGGRHSGEFFKPCPPYQIPYGVLLPVDVDNLLVPGACNSTHVGFCALRYEPIWMSLGQAAGHAVHVARTARCALPDLPVAKLQERLHTAGSATIYVSDVPPGHADFAAVQWWGTAGGFHGLAPQPAKPGERGKQIIGQYFEAFPNHAADLDRVLDEATATRWKELGKKLGLAAEQLPSPDGKISRGDWLRKAWTLPR